MLHIDPEIKYIMINKLNRPMHISLTLIAVWVSAVCLFKCTFFLRLSFTHISILRSSFSTSLFCMLNLDRASRATTVSWKAEDSEMSKLVKAIQWDIITWTTNHKSALHPGRIRRAGPIQWAVKPVQDNQYRITDNIVTSGPNMVLDQRVFLIFGPNLTLIWFWSGSKSSKYWCYS